MEYEDALDIPYQKLEEFADVLASKVLINSVSISRRENICSIRVSLQWRDYREGHYIKIKLHLPFNDDCSS